MVAAASGLLAFGKEFINFLKRYNHPNVAAGELAMRATANEFKCANGRGPEFHIGDKYISAELVREKESQEIVRFPETFICVHCGDISDEIKAWKEEQP